MFQQIVDHINQVPCNSNMSSTLSSTLPYLLASINLELVATVGLLDALFNSVEGFFVFDIAP